MFDPETYDYLERETIAEFVPINEMFVDRYQRPVKENKINLFLRAGFDPDALGSVILSLRGKDDPYPNLYAIVDGNCRVQMSRKVGLTHLFAKVLIDKTYEQEAALFRKLNTVRNPTPLDLFRSRIEEKELQALEMRGILEEFGLRVGSGSEGIGAINAVNALDRLYVECGPTGYREVIELIHAAWRKERRAWAGMIIDGVKVFWIRYYMECDAERLVDRLSLTRPEDLLRNAGANVVKQGSIATRIGRVIADTYNRGLKTRKLSEWVDYPGKGYDGKGGRPFGAKDTKPRQRRRPPQPDATP